MCGLAWEATACAAIGLQHYIFQHYRSHGVPPQEERQRGRVARELRFTDSPHCLHYVYHRTAYCAAVEAFLRDDLQARSPAPAKQRMRRNCTCSAAQRAPVFAWKASLRAGQACAQCTARAARNSAATAHAVAVLPCPCAPLRSAENMVASTDAVGAGASGSCSASANFCAPAFAHSQQRV